jgi:hypothetical protein
MKELVAGKSYKIRLNWATKPVKVYIEHILPSVYEDERLIVYRVWLKHKRYWHEGMCTKTQMDSYRSLKIDKK